MFEIITAERLGDPKISTAARLSVIRAGLHDLAMALRELPVVLPEMSGLQRAQVRLELCDAIRRLDETEGLIETVQRVCDSRPPATVRAENERAAALAEAGSLRADVAAS